MAAIVITTTSGVTMTGAATEGIRTVLDPVSDLAKATAVVATVTDPDDTRPRAASGPMTAGRSTDRDEGTPEAR